MHRTFAELFLLDVFLIAYLVDNGCHVVLFDRELLVLFPESFEKM